MQRIQRFLDYEQSLFFSKSVEQNARDSKTTTRMPEGARRERRLFSSRIAALVFRVSQLRRSTLARGHSSH